MVLGSGVDIIEVKRVKQAIKKWGDSFLKKVFTDKEVAYSKKRRFAYQHLAARFATKEAVLKAFGGGWLRNLPWKDVEIVNDKNGKPGINLYGEAKKVYNKKNIEKIVVSMSHTKEYAVANAILIKKDGK
ncbi:MAG: holo-ACP synthase [Candidatus Omnitrophica bacterium]|nr:holo-ACP synthase [Candidatus Omnitrophota bacterium]